MLKLWMKAFSGRRIWKVTSSGSVPGLATWLTTWGGALSNLPPLTSVEAYRSWILEVTWNWVTVGSLGRGEERRRGGRRRRSGWPHILAMD